MKILTINSKPNFDFFTKRGLILDITYDTCDKIFPAIKSGLAIAPNGQTVSLYSPDVRQYLEDTYKNTKHDLIIFKYDKSKYGDEFKFTGGQTFRQKLSNGAYFITVSDDEHVPHEIMHGIGQILYIDLKKYDVNDQMDATIVNGKTYHYYKNEQPEAPDSNFSVTWDTYKKHLKELNTLNTLPIVTIIRNKSTVKQTIGNLSVTIGDTKFTCKTLELPWLDNKKNISCIPKGTYTVTWTLSPRMLKYTYEVQKVPGRSGIRIHAGNFYKDFLGCIGLGATLADINKDGEIDITSSRNTVKAFEALMGGKPFTLVIK